jgi:hypothetical protein
MTDLELKADKYAYEMCGSTPCEDCNKFRHLITNEEKIEFINCSHERRCDEAKEYFEKYEKYKNEYLK